MPARRDSKIHLGDVPPPATTLEGREEQLVMAAMELAERRIYANEASSQEIVHFLRLGSTKHAAEMSKLENEVTVLQARVQEMESRGSSDELTMRALRAFQGYSGEEEFVEEDEVGIPEQY